MRSFKRSILLLICLLCLTLLPVSAAAAESDDGERLSASVAYASDQVTVTAIPDDAQIMVLAGYQGGKMLFSRFQTDLTSLPAAIDLPENHDAANKLKLYCLDGSFRPVGEAVVVQTALLPEEHGVSYYTAPDPEDIVLLEDTGTSYICGELLLTTDLTVDAVYVEALIEAHGGAILGCMENFGVYQLGFDHLTSADELQSLADLLAQDAHVQSACLHYMNESEVTWFPTTDYSLNWGETWDSADRASGNNWNLEAIHCPAAWPYVTTSATIPVGVIDGGFVTTQNGLDFARVWENDFSVNSAFRFNRVTHGTHVAGTIAATWNDGYTCGIVKNAEVYGFALNSFSDIHKAHGSLFTLQHALILMAVNDAKVVNYSMGSGNVGSDTMTAGSLAELDRLGTALGATIVNLVDGGYEILVVQSAGNDSNDNHPRASLFGTKYNRQGWVDTQWATEFSHVSQPEARDRVIIVGAYTMSESNGFTQYSVSGYSNIGDGVDILAPGGDTITPTRSTAVLSTVGYIGSYPNHSRSDDYCGSKMGTSMAAPHVAGVAAMVWAVDPDLTGPEVKDILLLNYRQTLSVDTSQVFRHVGKAKLDNNGNAVKDYVENPTVDPTVMNRTFTYPMLDAQSAVMAAYYEREIQFARAAVVDSKTGAAIPDAVITLYTGGEYSIGESFRADSRGILCEPIDNAMPADLFADIEAPGYETKTVAVSRSNLKQGYDLGTVQLEKAGEVVTVLASGFCSSTVTWTVTSDGTLTLSGSGGTPDYVPDDENRLPPWNSYLSFIKKAVVTEGITQLGWYNFAACTALTEVVLPSTLVHLGYGTFVKCNALQEVDLPDGIRTMGWDIFYICENLRSVTLPANLTQMGYHTFYGCKALTNITIPASLSSIPHNAFKNCTALKTVRFLGNAPDITNTAFENTSPQLVFCYRENTSGWTNPQWSINGVTYQTQLWTP